MMADSAELLRRLSEWLRAFGPGSVIQEPSWGVVTYHIPVKSMKLTPETMADVSTELLGQNNGAEAARIQYLGWLTPPGVRTESCSNSPAQSWPTELSPLVWYGGNKFAMRCAFAAKGG